MKRTLPALLALALAANVQAKEYKDGVIYCKATVVEAGIPTLSVYLPPTPGYSDYQGNPATVWNVGEVPPGGVADTFFSDKGPGTFQVKNDGNCDAFLYIVTGKPSDMIEALRADSGYHYSLSFREEDFEEGLYSMFGESINLNLQPRPSDHYQNGVPLRDSYRLAVSTDVTSKVPTWRPLNWVCFDSYNNGNPYYYFKEINTSNDYPTTDSDCGRCYQYLSHLSSGETQLFDLKFFAPSKEFSPQDSIGFIVIVEASEFRLWQHDM